VTKPPVFIVGSARSGTTLLYHSLLSSGGFADYRTEPAVFDLLIPKFGDMKKLGNRRRLMQVWLRSHQYRISGLRRDQLEAEILSECRTGGDFLRIVMNEIAQAQNVDRWAVWGPDNLLHLTAIAEALPDALFIHMIRDGRDVAVSMNKEGWIRPFPWDHERRLLVAALHWKWKVEQGRRAGAKVSSRYIEIRFEDLVSTPENTLARIGRFMGQDLNYSQIRNNPVGTLRNPNSTFRNLGSAETVAYPIERWKNLLSESDLVSIESMIGSLLDELGYPRASGPLQPVNGLSLKLMETGYPVFFSSKEWLRSRTPLGRLVSADRLRLDQCPSPHNG
jgi:hypothetical protein